MKVVVEQHFAGDNFSGETKLILVNVAKALILYKSGNIEAALECMVNTIVEINRAEGPFNRYTMKVLLEMGPMFEEINYATGVVILQRAFDICMMQPKPDIKFAQNAGLLMASLFLKKAKSKIGPKRNLTAIDSSLNTVIVLLVGGFGTSPIGRELLVLLLQEAHSWLEEDGTTSYLSFVVTEAIYSLQIGLLPKFLPYTWAAYSYDQYADLLDPRNKQFQLPGLPIATVRFLYYEGLPFLPETSVSITYRPYVGINGHDERSSLIMPYVDTRTTEELMGYLFVKSVD